MPKSPWSLRTRPLITEQSGSRKMRRAFLRLDELETRLMPAAPPAVLSINRALADSISEASSVLYNVTFDQPVTGVDATDFKVMLGPTARVSAPITVAG